MSCRPFQKSGEPLGNDERRSVRVVDFAIVGAGTAGAPLAKLLSDDRHVSVHVGEGGSDTRNDPNVLSGDTTSGGLALNTTKYHWIFGADPRPVPSISGAGVDTAIYLEGRMWGGSSGHNFLLAVRGTPGLYREWAAVNPRWSYEALLPTFKTLETYTPANPATLNPAQRGTRGPLFVTEDVNEAAVAPTAPLALAISSVAGVVPSVDYNDPTRGAYVSGASQYYTHPLTGNRSWAASAFLGPEIVSTDEEGNGLGVGARDLFIQSNAIALSLLFEDSLDEDELTTLDREFGLPNLTKNGCGRSCRCIDASLNVIGVRYLLPDERILDVFARRKVISCLGGVADPAFLQASGIGPREVLEPLGIEVRLDQPNVGRNMQNHYGPFVVLPFTPGDTSFSFQSFFPGPDSGADGPREYQGIWIGDLGQGFIAGILADLRPNRLGRVEIQRRGYAEAFITFNFYQDGTDLTDAVRMLRTVRDISLAYSGMEPILPDPSVYAAGDDALAEYVIANTLPFNHNSGTCRMALSAADGVVDGDLNVFGVRGLGIASNSVVPSINDGNTAWTAYIIGMTKAKIEGARVPF